LNKKKKTFITATDCPAAMIAILLGNNNNTFLYENKDGFFP